MQGQSAPDFTRLKKQLPEIQRALGEAELDGWLLYDLHARNGVAVSLLGLGDLSRRYFVLIPASGDPIAVTHGIEQGPWASWPWSARSYDGWRELESTLASVLDGSRRVAMEFSQGDAVPAVDLVPAGVIEMVREAGPDIVSSGDLLTRFSARWSAEDLASHRRASAILAQTAHTIFRRIASAVQAGETVTEGAAADWVRGLLTEKGLGAAPDCIVATGRNAADPHYSPVNGGATFGRDDLILLDLWSKESQGSVFADQTWMAYLGDAVPARAAELFGVLTEARDAAVTFLEEAWAAGRSVAGAEVDDVTRGVIRGHGYAEYFIHRTGHSIDQATHGMGPNIDNLETRETRLLTPGIGFSIEPGIYIRGDVGLRTEINVYIGENGPEVTTPDPQDRILPLLGA